jgi:RNA-directed DNA polymerase
MGQLRESEEEPTSKAKPFGISKRRVWEAYQWVRANKGAAGVDGESIEEFEKNLKNNLYKLWNRMSSGSYFPPPVRVVEIPKNDGGKRALGIPTVGDRVAQRVVKMCLEPLVEPYFHEESYGYRPGKSAVQAVGVARKRCWQYDWVLDVDIKGFFDNLDHELLLRALRKHTDCKWVLLYVERWLKAPAQLPDGTLVERSKGTPQGGVISPLLSNILLTPFDCEMRRRGYRLTRYADDWVVTCKTRKEAEEAVAVAKRILKELGVTLHAEKTRVVHVRGGFEFLGYKIKRGSRPLKLSPDKIRSGLVGGALYAYPRDKSIKHFIDQIRNRTLRKAPVKTEKLIEELNPVIRGWGNYYCKTHVRKLFNRLDRWILRRMWSHKYKRWRNAGWKRIPAAKVYGEMGLVNLVSLIPSLAQAKLRTFVKAQCGKTACWV